MKEVIDLAASATSMQFAIEKYEASGGSLTPDEKTTLLKICPQQLVALQEIDEIIVSSLGGAAGDTGADSSPRPGQGALMEFAEYEELHVGFQRALWLQLGLTCPLECGHCSVNAGPRPIMRSALSTDDVRSVIADFAATESGRAYLLHRR